MRDFIKIGLVSVFACSLGVIVFAMLGVITWVGIPMMDNSSVSQDDLGTLLGLTFIFSVGVISTLFCAASLVALDAFHLIEKRWLPSSTKSRTRGTTEAGGDRCMDCFGDRIRSTPSSFPIMENPNDRQHKASPAY